MQTASTKKACSRKDSPAAAPFNTGLPNPPAPNALIAYYWDDMDGGTTSFLNHGPTAATTPTNISPGNTPARCSIFIKGTTFEPG